MAGFRAYFDFGGGVPRVAALSPDESRHLCGSLRARAGDAVDLFDLAGNVRHCTLVSPSQKRAELEVGEAVEVPAPKPRVYLAQSLPKGKTFDDIVRQSVEVGAAGVFPLLSERTQVKISDSERKSAKWTAHVVEAVKQSGNFVKFEMPEPRKISDFLSSADFDLKIVASLEDGSKPIAEILRAAPRPKSVCVLVGPEGDLSPAEYALARGAGFLPATLGRNVMKCDTAALFALSAVSAFYA